MLSVIGVCRDAEEEKVKVRRAITRYHIGTWSGIATLSLGYLQQDKIQLIETHETGQGWDDSSGGCYSYSCLQKTAPEPESK